MGHGASHASAAESDAHETPTSRAFSEDIAVRVDDEDVPDDETGQVALDILELDTAIVIVAPMAGILLEDIDITVSRNILTLSGIRKKPPVYAEANQVLVEECFFGPFSRSIILPENLALNKVHATIENNLLLIDIPKLQFPSKSIKIDRLER